MLALMAVITPAQADDWEHVTEDEGVVVTRKSVPGRPLPIFRGVVTFNHSIYDVLAILDDVELRTKWVHRCAESRQLKRISSFARIIYNRTDAPWPVSDRDVIVKSQVTVSPDGQTVKISFINLDNYMPKRSGLVRIPYLEGHYMMEKLGETKTKVTYQLNSDPGGWLPNWIIKLASKTLPLKTLVNLRRQLTTLVTHGGGCEEKVLA